MSKVLVTGCAGYIGSRLIHHLLDKGHIVIGVDNFKFKNENSILPYLSNPRFHFHKMDIRKIHRWDLIDDVNVVIPLAALVGAPICEKRPKEAKEVNQDVITRIAQRVQDNVRIIYPNTNSGYGATDGKSECTENDPLNPISVYGITKCKAEKEVLKRQNAVVLRLATVFGVSPRMRFDLMVNDFTQKISEIAADKRENLSIFEPHFIRNFVHIDDVCRAFLFMINHKDLSGVFNLGLPEDNLSKMELAHTICVQLGVDKSKIIIGEGKDMDQRNYIVSNKKILDKGFQFTHSLEQGIRQVNNLCQLVNKKFVDKARNV